MGSKKRRGALLLYSAMLLLPSVNLTAADKAEMINLGKIKSEMSYGGARADREMGKNKLDEPIPRCPPPGAVKTERNPSAVPQQQKPPKKHKQPQEGEYPKEPVFLELEEISDDGANAAPQNEESAELLTTGSAGAEWEDSADAAAEGGSPGADTDGDPDSELPENMRGKPTPKPLPALPAPKGGLNDPAVNGVRITKPLFEKLRDECYNDNNPKSCRTVARIYANGTKLVEKNMQYSLYYQSLACEYSPHTDKSDCLIAANIYIALGQTQSAGDMLFDACDNTYGYPMACFELGLMYQYGNGRDKSIQYAAKYLKSACDKGISKSCTQYGKLLSEEMPPEMKPAALKAFKKACDGEDYNGCTEYGKAVLVDKFAPKKNRRAAAAFKKGCVYGSGEACFYVGKMMLLGNGTIKSARLAHKKITHACELGFADACEYLGDKYKNKGSINTAMWYYKKGCKLGSARACYALAYEKLMSPSPDPKKAQKEAANGAEIMKALCDSGRYRDACGGYAYAAAKGVVQAASMKTAIEYYKKGCKLGSKYACRMLKSLGVK